MKIIENTQFNRINLQFDEKPSKEILQKLKDEGWRYSPQHKLWYPSANAVENSRTFAEALQKDINNEASAYMESMQDAIDTNEPGFNSADERLSALVQNATDYEISPENTKVMVDNIKQQVINENESILEARLIQMEKLLLDMKAELQTTRERISKLENNNSNNNEITFPVVVLPQSSDFVESWSNNHNSVAKGLFIIKEDDKLVAIDNTDGECWVEDFDSLDKAVTYLTNSSFSPEEIRELNDADAHAAALNKLTEADLVLINDNILNSNVFVTADIGNPVELALHNPKTGEYFLIQSIDDDDRWDYTLYDKDFKLIDGGQGVSGDITMPEDIRTAAQVVLKEFHPDDLSINDWVIRDYSDLSELINEIEAANYERVVDSIQQNWTDHDNGVEQARDERDSREMNAELSRLDAEAEAMERANGLREMEDSAISKEEFNGFWIPQHNAVVMKKGLEENKAPFLPDAAGIIKAEAIYNANTGYCLPAGRLIPVQFAKMEMGYKSDIVFPRTTIIASGSSFKENEKGVLFNFKDEQGEVHTSSLFFPEQTQNPDILIAEYKNKIVKVNNLSDISMVIASSEPREYLGAYIAACRSGMKLSVDPQIADEFKTKIMPVLENDIRDRGTRDKTMPTLSNILFDAEKRGTEIVRTLSAENQNVVLSKAEQDIRDAQIKLNNIVTETFLTLTDEEKENGTTLENKTIRYEKWYKPMVDEIMADIANGNKEALTIIQNFDLDPETHVEGNKWYTAIEAFNRDVQYKLLPELYEKVQDRIKAEYEEKKIPYVVMFSSESPKFPSENKVYTVTEFNEILMQADSEFHNRKKYAEQKYGSADNYWDLERDDKLPEEDKGIQFGYDKTNFKFFNIPNPNNPEDTFEYEPSRYDIGDGNGSIFDYVRATCSHDEFIAALNALETQLYFPNLDNNHKQIIDNFVSEEKKVLSEKVQEAMKELDEAQSEYKELHKKWLIESTEANKVDKKLKAAVDNIHQIYEDSVNNIYDNVFENIPPTDRSLSLETSTTLRYMSNEAKKLCIESLYQPSRDAQKAMNAEDYKTYNSVDWAKLRRIWEQFPANVNMSNWTNTLLEDKIKDLGIELESHVEKTPAQTVTEEERESNINAAKAVQIENARKQYEAEQGSNYDSNLSTTDIARNLRNYIKQNHPGYKFSVTSQYFSGGSSISVKLKETPVEITNFELMKAYVEQNGDSNNNRIWDSETQKYTYYSELSEDKKKEFIEQQVRNAHWKNISEYSDDRSLAWMNEDVRKVYQDVIQHLESYNYDHSDSQSDYFSVNFYSHYGITEEAIENSHKHNVQKVRVNNESVSVPVESVEINTDVNQRLDAIINSFKESDLVLNVRKNDNKINVSIHEPESGNMIFTLNQTGNPVVPVLSNDLSMNEYEELKQLATEYFEIITENQTAPEYLENQFAKDIETKTPVQLEIISKASGILNDFDLNYDLLYQNDGEDRIQDIEQNIALKFDEAMRANGEFASIVRDLASIREDAFTSDRECAALFISLENAGYLNKITETKDVVIEDVYKLINENNDKELTQEDLDICKKVVPKQQLAFTLELTKGEEGEFFTNKLKQIADTYRKINTNKELINEDGTHNVGFRYFLGDTEIFLSEIDSDGIGFGYNILNGDFQMSEWGSTSLEEILSIPYMEMDYHVPDNATIEQMLYQEHPEYFSEYAPKEELKQEVQAEGKNLSAIVHPEVSYFVASNIEFEEELFSGLSLEEALAKYEELMSEDHSGYIPCIGIDTKDGSMYDSGPEGHGQVIYAGKIIEDVLKDIKYFKKMPEYVDAMKKLTEALMANGHTVENGNEFLESHKDIIEVNGIKYNSYYNSLKTREICHNIAGDDLDKRNEAVKTMADWFINQNVIGPDDILIPAPQHTGNAEYTKEIAELVSKATGAEIADILKCEPHEPLYEQKQAATPDLDPKLYVDGNIPEGKRLVLIDNVISTGVTFNEANRLIPGITPMVYAITDNANLRYQYEQYYAGTLKRQNYTIYQLKQDPDLHDICFASSKELKSMGKEIDFNNYEMVYSGHIDITHSMRNVNVTSEKIFEQLNNNRPDDYKAHSLSTSDIIVLEKEDGPKQAMFVDDIGFLHNTPELLQFVERMNERIGPDSSISWNELEKFFDGHIKSQLASFETTKQEVIEEKYDNEIQEKDETVGRMLMDNLDWHYFSDDGIDEENELSGKILEEKWSMIEVLEVRIVEGKVKTFEEAQIIINDQLLNSELYKEISQKLNQKLPELETKPYNFFVNDTANLDLGIGAEFEPVTGLTAEQAVLKYAELRDKGLSPYIGLTIPGDMTFDSNYFYQDLDPHPVEPSGCAIFTETEGKPSFYIGDSFVKDLKENDEHAQNVLAAYKELYETANKYILGVEKPNFVFDKEAELNKPTEPLKVYTFSPFGYEGTVVQVETDLRPGIPAFDIVGLADSAVKETRERIQAAFRNSGLEFPAERVLQSLSPADLRKDSPMDLSMALGILGQTNKYPVTEPVLALGELELSGGIRPVRGAVAAVNTAKAAGIKNIVCDPTTAELLKNIDGIKILTAESLKEVNEKLLQPNVFQKTEHVIENTETVQFNEEDEWIKEALDNLQMDGHFETIRAIEIAVAGKHNILATGAPGCGKTLLTQTLMPALTPKLTEEEAKQITRINSLAGLDSPKRDNLIPPFRMPHQTATIEGMCGGGPNCRPGEVSLSHKGTLFLDETAEFRSSVIQLLRVPIESRSITLSRAGRSTTYPADFQLAMAMNPCPCGCYGSPDKICLDSARSIEQYWKKISDPLLDRVEIKTFVQKDVKDTRKISIEEMKAQIATAFEIQRKRGVYNSHMTPEDIQKYCKLDNESQAYLDKEEDKLTSREKSNLLKLSLTIANMAGREEIHINDIKEARELSAPVFEKPRQFVYDPEEQKKATVPQLDDVSITPEQIKDAENERKRITEPVLNGERTEMYTSFKNFEDKGVFEINGTHLNVSKNCGLTPTGWKQLQAAMEIYRSKKFETFRYIIINEKTGEIADQLAITSHMPNFCNVSKPNDETLKQVISRLEELGDDYKLAVCHNHPSGNTTESSFDRELTDSLDRSLRRSDGMNKFLGHIILDHDTFNLAVPSQNNPGKCHWKKMEPQIVNEVDRFTADPKPEWAGDYVGGTSALKAVAVKINDTENWNDDFIPVVFTNADRNISGVQYYSKNFFENESSQIRNEFQFAAMEAGAIGAFPVITDALWNKLGKESNDFEAVMKAHVLNDAFTDVAFNHTTMTEKYDIEAGRNYYNFYKDQSDRKIDVVSTWTPSINTRLFPPELENKKEQEIER